MRFFTEAEEKLFEAFRHLAKDAPMMGKGSGEQLYDLKDEKGTMYRMAKTGGKLTFEVRAA